MADCRCRRRRVSALPKKIPLEKKNTLLQAVNLTDDELTQLYRRFRHICPQGLMEFHHFQSTLGMLAIIDDSFLAEGLFRSFNRQCRKSIDFLEFASSLGILLHGTSDEKLEMSYRIINEKYCEYCRLEGAQRDIAFPEGLISAGLTCADFLEVVIRLQNTRSMLIGEAVEHTNLSIAEMVFTSLEHSLDMHGIPRMALEHYKNAVRNSSAFLGVLGVIKGPSDNYHPGMTHRFSFSVDVATSFNLEHHRPHSNSLPHFRRLPINYGTISLDSCPEESAAEDHIVAEIRSVQSQLLSLLNLRRDGGLKRAQRRAQSSILSVRASDPASSDAPIPIALDTTTTTPQSRLPDLSTCCVSMESESELRSEIEYIYLDTISAESLVKRLSSIGSSSGAAVANCAVGTQGKPSSEAAGGPESYTDDEILDLINRLDHIIHSLRHARLSDDGSAKSKDSTLSASLASACVSGMYRKAPRHFINIPTNQNVTTDHTRGAVTSFVKHRGRAEKDLFNKKANNGFSVFFGHENWDLVLNMMIGIRIAAGRSHLEPRRLVHKYDFLMKEKFSIIPQIHEDKKAEEYVRFIDFGPIVFQRIRSLFGIHHSDYLRSVGPEQLIANLVLGNMTTLSELCSEGKSGSLFYFTSDGQFIIKTVGVWECAAQISKEEAGFLRAILEDYYDYLQLNPETLLTKFFGLHAISRKGKHQSKKLHFVVMENILCTPVEVTRRYDLKGSWIGRNTPVLTDNVTLKEDDLMKNDEKFELGPKFRQMCMKTLRQDATWLATHDIMDYSLLVGIHYFTAVDSLPSMDTPCSRAVFHKRDYSGMWSYGHDKLYYMGIIDMLTVWSSRKKLERAAKGLSVDPAGLSCMPPTDYAERFINFFEHTGMRLPLFLCIASAQKDYLKVEPVPSIAPSEKPPFQMMEPVGKISCDAHKLISVFELSPDVLVQPAHLDKFILEVEADRLSVYEDDPSVDITKSYVEAKQMMTEQRLKPIQKAMLAWVEVPIETAPRTRLCIILRAKDVKKIYCRYSQADRDSLVNFLTEAVYCNVGAALLEKKKEAQSETAEGAEVKVPDASTKDARWTEFEEDLMEKKPEAEDEDTNGQNTDVEIRQGPGGPEFFVNETQVIPESTEEPLMNDK